MAEIYGKGGVKSFDDSIIGQGLAAGGLFSKERRSNVGIKAPGEGALGRKLSDAKDVLSDAWEGWKGAGDIVSRGGQSLFEDSAVLFDENLNAYNEAEDLKSGKIPGPKTSPEFDKFNAGMVGKMFPEISEKYGTAAIGQELAKNQLEAVDDVMTHSGLAFNELKGLGLNRSQVWDEAQKRTQDPQELELVKQRLDEVYGPEDDGSFVKKTKQQRDVEDNVSAAASGADPTASEIPETVSEKFNIDQGSILAKAADLTSDSLHANHITPQNWYESRSFNMGLMRFGLGLLSGEDYATAFSNAAQDYTNLSDREKREAYADELVSSGYDRTSVMQWIDEGKANILTKPKAEETFSQYKDEAGDLWQKSSTTGKEQLLKAAEQAKARRTQVIGEEGQQRLIDLDTGETIEYYGARPAGGKGGAGGAGKGYTEQQNKMTSTGTYSSAYNRDIAEDPIVYGSDFVDEIGKKAGSWFAGSDDEYGRLAAEGKFGDDARRRQLGQDARRQFIERDLRMATGAVIAKGEAQPWINNLFTMSEKERESGISERKSRTRDIILSQAAAVSIGATNQVLTLPQVRMLVNGQALPLYSPDDPSRTAIMGLVMTDSNGKYLIGKDGKPVIQRLKAMDDSEVKKLREGSQSNG